MSRVGVVLPVRNDGTRARTAIRSILRQTWTDWQLVVVDDESDTPLADDIPEFLDNPRISVVRNVEPQGISRSINTGIALLDCELVARMDSDDFSHPERFAEQVDRLARNRELVALGTRAHVLLEHPDSGRMTRGRAIHCPVAPAAVRTRLLWGNPMVHSSVMMRLTALDTIGGYRRSDQAGFPEDLDLWTRLVEIGDIANLPSALHVYRRRQGSTTDMTGEEMGEQTIHLVRGYWRYLFTPSDPLDEKDIDRLVRLLVSAEVMDPALGTARSVSLVTRAFDRATRGARNNEARRELARMLQRVVRLNVKARIT